MKIVVGSLNAIKIGAVRDAFKQAYPQITLRVSGMNALSGVPSQPRDDAQCIQGARNRAQTAMKLFTGLDFAVGIEGGICRVSYGDSDEGWFERTWVVVINNHNDEGIGSSASVRVTDDVVGEINAENTGLGRVTDARLGTNGISRGKGYCGVATKGILNRREVTRDAIIAALAVFLHPEFFTRPPVHTTV